MTDTTIARQVRGICHHDCPDSCGWIVDVDTTGRAVALRGDPDHPYSRGELCPKVNRFIDRVYSPDRITTPLRRVGAKGSGEFEPVSWDEALTDIAAQLNTIIATHGGEAVLPYYDAGNQSLLAVDGISARFMHHIGATRLIRNICGPTAGAGMAMTNGTGLGMDPDDLAHSQLILLWGTNTRLTNRHLWPTLDTARANGAQIVVIDPIRTITAERVLSDGGQFIQPRPGTDVALMMAVMHELIATDLIDHDWVADHTLGFDELAAHVADTTPEWASEHCGVDPDVIRGLAKQWGSTGPAAIRTLVGAEHHRQGGMFFRTLACLPALTGAWRHRGGGMCRSVGAYQAAAIDEAAFTRPDLLAGRTPRSINMSRLGEALHDAAPAIHAMVVWCANPVVIAPNASLIRSGMMRDDLFCVVHEQFMTDTALYADYVLPATTQIESVDVNPAWGHLWMGWNHAAIDPVGESVSNTELFRRLSRAMGFTEPCLFDDDDTLLRTAITGVDIDTIRDTGPVKVPFAADGRPWANGGFPTPSGRVEFASNTLEAIGQPRLPTFVPSDEGLASDLAQRYPLQLMTPKHHVRFLNSSYSQLPGHGDREGGPFVEMDAADAAARGLNDGDTARVMNDRAELQLPVRISTRLQPGVVAIPWGWWSHQHPDGRVANELTNNALTDWGDGAAFYDTLVEIAPA